MGVFHPDLVGIQVRVLQRLGSRHVLVVYGKDGMDEVSLGAATMVGELKDGEVREYEIHPEDFGLRMISNRGLKVADAAESKEMVLEALGNVEGTPREIVVLNAGRRAVCGGRRGVDRRGHRARARGDRARARAKQKLEQFVASTQEARRRERLIPGSCADEPTSSRGSSRRRPTRSPRRKRARPFAEVAAAARAQPPPRDFDRRAAREDRRRTSGGHRRDQEGEPEPGRVARRFRSAGDRGEL